MNTHRVPAPTSPNPDPDPDRMKRNSGRAAVNIDSEPSTRTSNRPAGSITEALSHITVANQAIAVHVESATSNRCVTCDQLAPCAFRSAAEATLRAHGTLPRRIPGATARAAGVMLAGRHIKAALPQHATALPKKHPFVTDWFTAPHPDYSTARS